MILEGSDTPEALMLLLSSAEGRWLVLDGAERFGGFRSKEHAEWFVRMTGRTGATIEETR